MEIEQQIWGSTPEGEAVVLYTLRNAAGAEVQLLVRRRGRRVDPGSRPRRTFGRCGAGLQGFPQLFRRSGLMRQKASAVAGCIAYGVMAIDGQEYRLDVNGMAGTCQRRCEGIRLPSVGEPCGDQPGRDVALFRKTATRVSR